jgi:hypothetical protein
MNNWYICWLFTHIFTAQRLYKLFGVKGFNIGGELMTTSWNTSECRTTKLGEFNPTHFFFFIFMGGICFGGRKTD